MTASERCASKTLRFASRKLRNLLKKLRALEEKVTRTTNSNRRDNEKKNCGILRNSEPMFSI